MTLKKKTFDSETAGIISVFIATTAAGINIYLAKIISFINRFLLTALMFSLSGLILLTVNILLGKITDALVQGRRHFLKFLWIGVIGTSIPMSMVFYGLALSPISNTFLLQTEVIYSMILSRLLLKERISRQQILLSLLAFLGIFLITTEGRLKGISAGDILFLLAPFFFQCAHIVAKNLMRNISPIIVVMYRLLIGGVFLLAVLMLFGLNPIEVIGKLSLHENMTIFCLGINYALGNSFWYYGVKNINLSKATAIIITYPLISMILAILTLEEKLSPIKTLGICMIFLSVLRLSLLRSARYPNDNQQNGS